VDSLTRGPHGPRLLRLRRGPVERGFAPTTPGCCRSSARSSRSSSPRGGIRAVFATETLALGINMPARTVVLEKLVKFNGEAHVDMTPAEYTQLTGRAGRRGIDIEGHAVVQWARGSTRWRSAGLASTRTYPLRSSFRADLQHGGQPRRPGGRTTAREILETSFAQFQADRAVVGLATKVRRNEEGLDGYAEAMHCHLGDFREYAGPAAQPRRRGEGRGARAIGRPSRRGRPVAGGPEDRRRHPDPGGRRSGLGRRRAAPEPATGGSHRAERGHRGQAVAPADPVDVPGPVEPLARVSVPAHFNPKSPKSRRDLATSLRIAAPHGLDDAPSRRQGRGGDDRGRTRADAA
jgi:ATP-dependent RNA helicase HelY